MLNKVQQTAIKIKVNTEIDQWQLQEPILLAKEHCVWVTSINDLVEYILVKDYVRVSASSTLL